MKRALYINKFGIFHAGHIDVVKYISGQEDVDEIIMAITSSQFNDKNKSPNKDWIYNCLTWQERKKIIEVSLEDEINKKLYLIPVPDTFPIDYSIKNNKRLKRIKQSVPKFDYLFSNYKHEKQLFEANDILVREVPRNYKFTDHCIRDKIARHEIWQPFFKKQAADLLKNFNIEDRLAKLYAIKEMDLSRFSELDYEWRTFEKIPPDSLIEIIEKPPFKTKEEQDDYIVSLIRTSINFKIRENSIKAKELLTSEDGIELYSSVRLDFPLFYSDIISQFREFRFPLPRLEEPFTKQELISNVSKDVNPYLFQLEIKKQRQMYLYADISKGIRCGIDLSTFWINNQEFKSFGLEAKTGDEIKYMLEKFNLRNHKPMNYIQFIEKLMYDKSGDRLYKNLKVE